MVRGCYVNKNPLTLAMTPRKALFVLEAAQSAPEQSWALSCTKIIAPFARPAAFSL
jgi:hypothetical protein